MVLITGVCIVKNESTRIVPTLESMAPYVDRFVVCDTGSSDATIDEVRSFFDTRGSEDQLISFPFLDFANARNTALRAADSGPGWLLMFDCDMRVEGDPQAFRTELACVGAQAASLPARLGVCQYERLCLFRAGLGFSGPGTPEGWHFCYPVHEVPAGPDERWKLSGPVLSYEITDPERRKARWQNFDLPKIRAFLQKNPQDLRMLFYLGQTLECLERFPEAIKAYERRLATKPGFIPEEDFVCRMRIGDCHFMMGNNDGAMTNWLKAFAGSPERAEPLEKIARLFMASGHTVAAWHFAQGAAALPFPADARLFVDADLYQGRAVSLRDALEQMLRGKAA